MCRAEGLSLAVTGAMKAEMQSAAEGEVPVEEAVALARTHLETVTAPSSLAPHENLVALVQAAGHVLFFIRLVFRRAQSVVRLLLRDAAGGVLVCFFTVLYCQGFRGYRGGCFCMVAMILVIVCAVSF